MAQRLIGEFLIAVKEQPQWQFGQSLIPLLRHASLYLHYVTTIRHILLGHVVSALKVPFRQEKISRKAKKWYCTPMVARLYTTAAISPTDLFGPRSRICHRDQIDMSSNAKTKQAPPVRNKKSGATTLITVLHLFTLRFCRRRVGSPTVFLFS